MSSARPSLLGSDERQIDRIGHEVGIEQQPLLLALTIALDRASARATTGLEQAATTSGARFLFCLDGEGRSDDALVAGDGSKVRLAEAVAGADAVVLVATAGERAEAARWIGPECAARRIMTTGVILGSPGGEVDSSVALKNLRRYAAMLVITTDVEYLADMLRALRA